MREVAGDFRANRWQKWADQIDEIVQNTVRQANLIVFSIGGNDLFLSARAKWNGRQLKAVSVDELTVDLEEAAGRFRSITSRLHALNPNATVVYMGLYNPFFDIDELRDASLKIQLWNKEAYGALHDFPLMRMAPTFDLFEDRIIERLSSDHFHPNGDGYDLDSCRNVRISDCYFDTGDDCIVIKSGKDLDGRRVARPTELADVRPAAEVLARADQQECANVRIVFTLLDRIQDALRHTLVHRQRVHRRIVQGDDADRSLRLVFD